MNDSASRRRSVLVVADGDPMLRSTNSGVALGVTRALGGRTDIDYSGCGTDASRPAKALLLARSLLKKPRAVGAEFRFGEARVRSRSLNRDRAVRRHRVDHVLHVRNIYTPCATDYAAFIDATSLQKAREWPKWQGHRIDLSARLEIERAYYRSATAVFSAGHGGAQSVIMDYGVAPERVLVVGAGVDPVPLGESPPVDREEISVLFIGSDFERKGGADLLAAISGLRAAGLPITCDVVGPSADPAPSLAWCRWHGWVSDGQQMAELFRAADMFSLPARHEPFGRVVLEAMSHGLTPVVTDVNELGRLVDHNRTGLVVPPGDPHALAEAIRVLARDENLRARLGEAARISASASSWDSVVAAMLTHWEELGGW